MELTPHQRTICEGIKAALRKGEKRIKLIGSAGVGKTALATKLVEEIVKDYSIVPQYNNGLVYITAPTHKALSILQKKIEGSSRVVFKTIHSALKMKMFTDERTGFRKFVSTYDKSRDADFKYARVCIIDEASMLNTEFTGGTIYDKHDKPIKEVTGFLEKLNVPIIFIGDDKQLNPVGEPLGSPIFLKDYPTFELTEIIRQGEGNPIIDLSRDLDMIFFKRPRLVDGKGYVYDDNKIALIDNLAEVNGTDELKYLAYMNDDIDWMNTAVRKKRYGNPERIEKEETIVMNATTGEYFTNQEVKVIDLDIATDWINVPAHNCRFDGMDLPIGPFNKIKLKYYRINDGFNVIHEDSEKMYKTIVSAIADNCSKNGWNWKSKYWFEEQFTAIKYNHAITIHKSQGSTYKHTILNIQNILRNRKINERTRMLYTGITRASDLVILNNV